MPPSATNGDFEPMLGRLQQLPSEARQRYRVLLARDLCAAIEHLKGEPNPETLQRTLHSLVGVLGTAAAPCHALACEAYQLSKQQQLTRAKLTILTTELEALVAWLQRGPTAQ